MRMAPVVVAVEAVVNTMKIILRTHPKRSEFLPYLLSHLPDETIISNDKDSLGAISNFLNALTLARQDSAIHIEDDCIFAQGYFFQALEAIRLYPSNVIQFFSTNKHDKELGSRLDQGKNFLFTLFFYLPPNYSKLILEHYPHWPRNKNNWGCDLLVADFLHSRQEIYYSYSPSLVNHRETVSVIDPNRSQKRQSFSFIDAI